ncbi:MAG: HD domain-containing protein [Bacteroidetes bacterium]|nr:HD domain-containing protein [Bacteroidota bacterium]
MSVIIEKSSAFVFDLLKKKLPDNFIYHNYTHTQRVVKSLCEIIEHTEGLTEDQIEVLKIAAWFHDTGYTKGCENHETSSVELAKEFLESQSYPKEKTEAVCRCIMDTRFDVCPTDLLGKIMRDADASHFAKDYYEEASEFLRLEYKLQGKENYSVKNWRKLNIKLLSQDHEYYTDYAIRNWTPLKEKNLLNLLEKQKKDLGKLEKERQKAKIKDESPERAIQSMFRVTMQNHLKLSDIADTKANILLSVNAIIISLVLSNLISKLDSPSNQHLILPSLILTLSSVVSIVFAILSTRPKITSGEFTREEVEAKKINVLFFGNFHKMPFEQFKWAVGEIIQEKSMVYEALTRDLYYLGVVLHKKYRLLRITYNAFMVGIIISVISFIISFFFLKP